MAAGGCLPSCAAVLDGFIFIAAAAAAEPRSDFLISSRRLISLDISVSLYIVAFLSIQVRAPVHKGIVRSGIIIAYRPGKSNLSLAGPPRLRSGRRNTFFEFWFVILPSCPPYPW